MLTLTDAGLFCPAGGFHIDPWKPVDRAVLTHAHADHARPGNGRVLCAAPGQAVMNTRIGGTIDTLPWGESVRMGEVAVSLHPAGHVLGSAQIRLEHGGEVWVVTGDYKRQPDPTCAPFEPLRCHTLVTEATFALPVYRWNPQEMARIAAWWARCRDRGVTAVLGTYALGKAQRILASLERDTPIWLHGAIDKMNACYPMDLGPTAVVVEAPKDQDWSGALVLAPPGALGSRFMRRFKDPSTALASGWMHVRGNRRWKAYDQGFAVSDHADWPALLRTVAESEAERVLVTHGSSQALARYLREERGQDAEVLETEFSGESEQ